MLHHEPKTPIYFLRRGTLYGAALGLLLGLANVSVQSYSGIEAILYWRNWILGGAAVGFLAGAIKALQVKTDQAHTNTNDEISPRLKGALPPAAAKSRTLNS